MAQYPKTPGDEHQIAVITGAASGAGTAIGRRFAAASASAVVVHFAIAEEIV